MKNLPERLLVALDRVAPPDVDPPPGASSDSFWSEDDDGGEEEDEDEGVSRRMEVDPVTGLSTRNRMSAFEAKLLTTPTWAATPGFGGGGGGGSGATGRRDEREDGHTSGGYPASSSSQNREREKLTPTQIVEILDETVGSAVVGAGPLRLDREQLGRAVYIKP